MNNHTSNINAEYDAQDLLFELSEFCMHDQKQFNRLANILLQVFTVQSEPGVLQLKTQEAFEAFTIKLCQVGSSINTVPRERAQLEFLSRIGLIKTEQKKQALTNLVASVLGEDGTDVTFANHNPINKAKEYRGK